MSVVRDLNHENDFQKLIINIYRPYRLQKNVLFFPKQFPNRILNFGSLCQGVIFDAEDQPDILTPLSQNGASRDEHSKNCGPFIPEQESPLQRPRPPERLQPPPRKRSFQNRWSQRLSSAVIINRSPNNFTNQRLTPLFFAQCLHFGSFIGSLLQKMMIKLTMKSIWRSFLVEVTL